MSRKGGGPVVSSFVKVGRPNISQWEAAGRESRSLTNPAPARVMCKQSRGFQPLLTGWAAHQQRVIILRWARVVMPRVSVCNIPRELTSLTAMTATVIQCLL